MFRNLSIVAAALVAFTLLVSASTGHAMPVAY